MQTWVTKLHILSSAPVVNLQRRPAATTAANLPLRPVAASGGASRRVPNTRDAFQYTWKLLQKSSQKHSWKQTSKGCFLLKLDSHDHLPDNFCDSLKSIELRPRPRLPAWYMQQQQATLTRPYSLSMGNVVARTSLRYPQQRYYMPVHHRYG